MKSAVINGRVATSRGTPPGNATHDERGRRLPRPRSHFHRVSQGGLVTGEPFCAANDSPVRERPPESVDGWFESVLNSKCLAIEESTPRPMPHGWEEQLPRPVPTGETGSQSPDRTVKRGRE